MKRSVKLGWVLAFVAASFVADTVTQAKENKNDSAWTADTFKGLELRGLGPGFMSGRIADVAIHPQDENLWYVAVGSGGVWKTVNAGVTFKPVFDDQPSYSIGCVTVDPSNPHRVWVGTGENVARGLRRRCLRQPRRRSELGQQGSEGFRAHLTHPRPSGEP
jgi:hypothetical protein